MFPCSPQVVVSVGRSLSYTPGSITLVTSTVSQFPVTKVVGGVAGGGVSLFLLLVLVVAIVLVAHRRDSLKKRRQVNALMMQMETLETNMAEECKRGNVTSVCACVCVHACMCVCVCV